MLFSHFNFQITYKLRSRNRKKDVLSQKAESNTEPVQVPAKSSTILNTHNDINAMQPIDFAPSFHPRRNSTPHPKEEQATLFQKLHQV